MFVASINRVKKYGLSGKKRLADEIRRNQPDLFDSIFELKVNMFTTVEAVLEPGGGLHFLEDEKESA